MSSTASVGYAQGTVPAVSEWNWMLYDIGLWTRHFHERGARTTDLFDSGASTVYRVSASVLGFSVGGALTQSPISGGTYYWSGDRLVIEAGSAALTFAAASTNYVHLRTQSSVTSRDPTTQVLVSTNASETGYIAVLRVSTDATTITAEQDLSTAGPYAFAPWKFERIDIEPVSVTGPSALAITYPNSGSGTAALYMEPASAAVTRTAVQVDTRTADGTAAALYTSSTTFPTLQVFQEDTASAIYAENSGGGDVIDANADTSGTAARLTATSGASTLTLTPVALGPSTPLEGDVYIFETGEYNALRFYESGKTRYAYSGQDGIAPLYAMSTSTTTLTPGAGPTTIQSTSYTFRQGGYYRIVFSCLWGGVVPTDTVVVINCRINGVAISGASARTVDPAAGAFQYSTGGSTQFTSHWYFPYFYFHGGVDASLTVDMNVTSSGTTGNRTFTNRCIEIFCLYS